MHAAVPEAERGRTPPVGAMHEEEVTGPLLEDTEAPSAPLPAVPTSALDTEILPAPAHLPAYPGVAVAGAPVLHTPAPSGSSAPTARRSAKRRGRTGHTTARSHRARQAPPSGPWPDDAPVSTAAQADLAVLAVEDAAVEPDWESVGLGADQLNNDYCETCHGHGRFLCCDGCPRSFHFGCVNPPLKVDEMPVPNGPLLPKRKADAKSDDPRAARADADDSWYCRVCFSEQLPPKPVRKAGPVGLLIQQLQCENPQIFALPVELRNYFKGVSTAADGAYVDSTSLRPLKLSRHGFVEERDAFQLRDKHGEAVLCYQCGGSALPLEDVLPAGAQRAPTPAEELQALELLADEAVARQRPLRAPSHGRRILGCDFCSLFWHLDCTDPPLPGMPPPTRRWKCPAHSSHAEPRIRVPRGSGHVKTIDVPLATAPGAGALRAHGEVVVLPDPDDRHFDPVTGKGRSGFPYEEVVVRNANGTRLRYHIPEKTVRLEFWHRASLARQAAAVPRHVHTPAAQGNAPLMPPPASAFDQLVATALADGGAAAPPPPPAVPRAPDQVAAHAAAARASLAANQTPFDAAHRSTYRADEAGALVPAAGPDALPTAPPEALPWSFVYPSELAELRAVKQLMAAKGQKEMLAFLQSQ